MKKIWFLFPLLLITFPLQGMGLSGIFKGGYFVPHDRELQEIYHGGFFFEREINYAITSNILTWGSAGFFRKCGELHETHEKTRLMLIPAGLGLKVRLSLPLLSMIRFYAGGGVQYIYASMKNESEIVEKKIHNHGIGWVAKGGIQVAVGFGVVCEAFANYMDVKATLRDVHHGEEESLKTNVGGWVIGLGAGYEF